MLLEGRTQRELPTEMVSFIRMGEYIFGVKRRSGRELQMSCMLLSKVVTQECKQAMKGLLLGMKEKFQKVISQCEVCQRNKDERVPYPGLLQPLPIPEKSWSPISVDFIEGLPKSRGKDVIMVVVDRYTRYGHFIAMPHPYSAQKVAELFLENIHKLHGIQECIV